MIEPEVAWNDSADNMRLQEDFVSFVVQRCLERRAAELKELERDTAPLERVKAPFHRVNYSDAVTILQGKGSSIIWGDDLGAEDEALLVADYDRPVFVMNYPKEAKAFYMKENPDDPRTVLCNDCLAPEGYGEIIGGSQREDDYEKLLHRIHEEGLPWMPTAGTSTSAGTERSFTRASDSGSSEPWRGSAGCRTSAK